MSPLTPALTPAQRLALSRERLRLALHERARAPDELSALLQGLTRQHPTAAVLAAAAVGALLVWLRPWRRAGTVSPWVAALLPGLLPVLGSVLAAVAKDQRWSAWLARWCPAATTPDQASAPFGAAPSAPDS
ncbi:MAG: hypothetical protein IPJ08_13340 [Burkholderiales bacterium]|nr:hypothetical protein [Burkholderiales bacterium]MBP6405203.1 hypothetical protein [Ramlibacter sp.]